MVLAARTGMASPAIEMAACAEIERSESRICPGAVTTARPVTDRRARKRLKSAV